MTVADARALGAALTTNNSITRVGICVRKLGRLISGPWWTSRSHTLSIQLCDVEVEATRVLLESLNACPAIQTVDLSVRARLARYPPSQLL